MNGGHGTTRSIGVHPKAEFERHSDLWQSVEQLYDVRFFPASREQLGASPNAVVFGNAVLQDIPMSERPVHWVLFTDPDEVGAVDSNRSQPALIQFADAEELDPVLRGRTLTEDQADPTGVASVSPSDTVLASIGDRPMWVRRQHGALTLDLVAGGIEHWTPDEVLADRMRPGRFFPTLALIQFLRSALGSTVWQPPRLRAAYIVDDPNLHAKSYGYINFSRLAQHADEHNYHVAMATIPIDSWFASSAAVHAFRDNARRLSLLIHGNNHTKRELAQPLSAPEFTNLLAQALRRINRFEKRSGLVVSRVMAAPHGVCDEPAMQAMRRLGFEGIAVNQPFQGSLADRPRPSAANWQSADIMAGGLPAMQRIALSDWAENALTRERLVLSAFLGKPLILYGHHDDFTSGFDVLAASAEQINALGEVEWMPFDAMCRSNILTRRESDTLHAMPLAVAGSMSVPDDVRAVVVQAPAGTGPAATIEIEGGNSIVAQPFSAEGVTYPCPPGESTLRFRITFPDCVDPAGQAPPTRNGKAVLRRLLTESRDRLQPLAHR